MTRERVIEVMAKALYRLAWGSAAHWPPHNAAIHKKFLEKGATALAALEAAGMVVVPREPTPGMVEAGFDAYRAIERATITDTVSMIYRAMTEAAHG